MLKQKKQTNYHVKTQNLFWFWLVSTFTCSAKVALMVCINPADSPPHPAWQLTMLTVARIECQYRLVSLLYDICQKINKLMIS